MFKVELVRAAAALAAATVAVCGPVATMSATAADSSAKSYTLKATLSTKQEVPAPKDAVHAAGAFTGKLTLAGKKSSFTWRLRVSHLSGGVREADVAMGARGKKGVTVLPLCKKCLATSHGAYIGAYVDNKMFVQALLHGQMYVTVTTKLNSKGEIRGQIAATAA